VNRITGHEIETLTRTVKRKSKVTAAQFPSIKILEIESQTMKRMTHVGTEKYLRKFIVKPERKKLLWKYKHKIYHTIKCILRIWEYRPTHLNMDRLALSFQYSNRLHSSAGFISWLNVVSQGRDFFFEIANLCVYIFSI